MPTAQDILAQIKEKDVKYVDVRFTDVRGKMQHVTFDIDLFDEDFLTDGTMFDGSSIAGWKAINESDMKLRPDLSSASSRERASPKNLYRRVGDVPVTELPAWATHAGHFASRSPMVTALN